MNYSYLSDGTKLSATDGSGEGLVYRGPFVYRKSAGSSSLTLESAAFGGGRLTPTGAMFYVRDYLGSVRAVVDGKTGQLYKAADYSAFGDESAVMVPAQGSIPAHQLATASLPSGLTLRDGYTGKEDQTPDFSTGYTDFGARQYSPALRRWMTPDPLSEKYYGISPYAFCANNPVNLVDPDGERWVNKQKQIVCDANGPTSYATLEEVELIKAMKSIKTGRQQLQKLIEAPFDVQVYINSAEKPNKYGKINSTININKATNQFTVTSSLITIYEKNAEDRATSTGLTITQAMAVNLAHEIEHTTKENIELSINNADGTDKEAAPKQISQQMLSEFILMKPLPRIESLHKFTFQQLYYQEVLSDSIKLK